MAVDSQPAKTGSVRSLMPPYLVLEGFLPEASVAGFLAHAAARRCDFLPTRVRSNLVNPLVRVSLGTRDIGDQRQMLEDKVMGLLPELVDRLRVSPVESPRLELELVAHGEGAFLKRHIDTRTDSSNDSKRIRVVSGVYYFHAQPKGFTGGALRLHAIGGEAYVDIEPVHNSLLVFPSWAPHEVLPVACPSRDFLASRFAVNCWIHGKRKPADA